MQGYDTLVGVWNELDRDWQEALWQGVSVKASTGVAQWRLNLADIQFTRTEAPTQGRMETAFQVSLPKVLYGVNTRTLPIDDHLPALAQVDMLIQREFPGAPPVSEMTPRRVDATDDRSLSDERRVVCALRRLEAVELRGKRPVVGQAGTVSWPGKRGGHTSKAYSKYRESGSEEAIGTLRVERGAIGLAAVRLDHEKALYGKALAASVSGGHLTIGQALSCPGLAGAILGVFPSIVDSVLTEGERMDTLTAIEKLKAAGCKYGRCVQLIGYAHLVQLIGWDAVPLSRQQKWEARKDFTAAGIDPAEVVFPASERLAMEIALSLTPKVPEPVPQPVKREGGWRLKKA